MTWKKARTEDLSLEFWSKNRYCFCIGIENKRGFLLQRIGLDNADDIGYFKTIDEAKSKVSHLNKAKDFNLPAAKATRKIKVDDASVTTRKRMSACLYKKEIDLINNGF